MIIHNMGVLQRSVNFSILQLNSLAATLAGSATTYGFRHISISPDGTSIYMTHGLYDRIYEFELSTPNDLSTLSYTGGNFGVTHNAFDISSNGGYILTVRSTILTSYSLITPWNLSSVGSLTNISFRDPISNVRTTLPTNGVRWSYDGTKVFIGDNTNSRVDEYNLSTAWDVSTAVFSTFLDVSVHTISIVGISFSTDGSSLYINGNSNVVQRYELSTPWDISTGVYIKDSPASDSTFIKGMVPFGSNFYVVGLGGIKDVALLSSF